MLVMAHWILFLCFIFLEILDAQAARLIVHDDPTFWPPLPDEKVVILSSNDEIDQMPRDLVQVGGCYDFQFSCSNGLSCLPGDVRCDGNDDCGDGSDEKDCNEATPSPIDTSCASCGVKYAADSRIVNGQETGENEWPWQVYVQIMTYSNTYACGGSLFKTKYVITAAHCFDMSFTNDTEVTYVRVYVGDHALSGGWEPEAQKIYASIVFVHSMYKKPKHELDNDIAIIQLKYPVVFTDRVRPICLPKPKQDFSGKTLWVTGWGQLGTGKGTPNTLQEISVKIFSRKSCLYRGITRNMICGRGKKGKKVFDTCRGDSGGPLVYKSDGKWVLAGIVSFGAHPCGFLPSVYTKVTNYIGWITRMTYDGKC